MSYFHDMTQTVLSPAQLWPGGIPSTIHLDPDGDCDIKEEIKGWCQFLKESWTPLPSPEDDRAQRRALIEKWASADQSFRDSYLQTSTPLPDISSFSGVYCSKRFICLADKPCEPENYSRITKLLILLYIHIHGGCHPLSYNDPDPNPQLPVFIFDPNNISLDTSTQLLAPENIPVTFFLETADFSAMAMTQAGTVIFPLLTGFEYVVIDNQTYQDGCLLLLNFAVNGQVAHQARMLPYRLGRLKSIRHGLGHLWSELFDMPDVNPRWNQPIDLQPPLLEILATISQRGDLEHLNDYKLAEWTEELEWFAPEYLAYEREGRVAEYSWDQLADVTDSGYNHIRDRRLMIAMGMRPV